MTSVDSGKVKIYGGKGDTKVSWTDPADVAGFTAYIITHLPPAQLSNKVFRIEGENASLLDYAGYAQKPVEYVDKLPDDFQTLLQGLINSGKMSTAHHLPTGKVLTGSDEAGASDALWPGHHWKGIKEVLGL